MNCLSLGLTAILLDTGLIDLNADTVQTLDESYHFGNLSTFNGLSVVDDITMCILDTCQNTTYSSCDPRVPGYLSGVNNSTYNITQKLAYFYNGLDLYCHYAATLPSSDVLGPAVLLASLLQCAVTTYFFVVFVLHNFQRYINYWTSKVRGSSFQRLESDSDSDPKPSRFRRKYIPIGNQRMQKFAPINGNKSGQRAGNTGACSSCGGERTVYKWGSKESSGPCYSEQTTSGAA
ncbi:hypothetical protein F5Y16DRAFT_406887 [Xylariaceae sp. FL0255]|nr:hypothetical protein F5Y16DRAFT_406887 [Xylariaceae sp. FL0255]